MFTHFLRKYESSEEATGKKKLKSLLKLMLVEAENGRARQKQLHSLKNEQRNPVEGGGGFIGLG